MRDLDLECPNATQATSKADQNLLVPSHRNVLRYRLGLTMLRSRVLSLFSRTTKTHQKLFTRPSSSSSDSLTHFIFCWDDSLEIYGQAIPRSHSVQRLPVDESIEEECVSNYDPNHFYPMRLFETLNNRYLISAKLGHGCESTVWLARDLKT